MKKSIKKVLATGLVVAMACTAVGCGSTTESTGTEAKTAQETQKTQETEAGNTEAEATPEVTEDTLTVAIWDTNQEPGLTQIINDFTAETGILFFLPNGEQKPLSTYLVKWILSDYIGTPSC